MICRDPSFWRPICEHPEVKPHVSLGSEHDWLTPLLENPRVLPFIGERGGYFLVDMAHGRIWDLHAAFLPSGWGKDASATLKRLLGALRGWDAVTSLEVEGNWRSRPPRSFGFRPAAPMRDGYRTHVLTRTAWEASPAFRRMNA